MPVGSAASQMMRGDTTKVKKATPVDTVRLKKNMKQDEQDAQNVDDMARKTGNESLSRATDALFDRGLARKDTLEAARKGKIPVKKP